MLTCFAPNDVLLFFDYCSQRNFPNLIRPRPVPNPLIRRFCKVWKISDSPNKDPVPYKHPLPVPYRHPFRVPYNAPPVTNISAYCQ